jgi:hypothetical protein
MPFTTGLITNTRDFGTAASNIVISTKNEDTINLATIIVQIYNSPTSTTLSPLYASSFVVPPNSINVSEFFIAGNVAYEVQFNVTSQVPTNVVLTVFGLNEFGNLVTNQRVLQSEFTSIPALSPLS